jgi:hypothetical protein
MSTEQNYSEGDNYATTSATPSINRQVRHFTPNQICEALDWLYAAGKLTQSQWQFGEIIPITNDGMAPQLIVGGAIAIHWIDDEDDYCLQLEKVVAIRLKGQHDAPFVGRLVKIDQTTVVFAQDNKGFSELVFDRQQVDYMYEVVCRLDMPVL